MQPILNQKVSFTNRNPQLRVRCSSSLEDYILLFLFFRLIAFTVTDVYERRCKFDPSYYTILKDNQF